MTASTHVGAGRSPLSRVNGLDGLRAIAALMVLVSHVAGDADLLRPAEPGAHLIDNFGNFGVAVFFVLSGFVIYRPFAEATLRRHPPPSVPAFYTRRAFRIFPAYWIALLVWAISASSSAKAPGTTGGKLLLTDIYDPSVVWLTGLSISWTLTVEIAFYLLLPAYALSIGRIARKAESPITRFRIHLGGLLALYVSAFVYRVVADHSFTGRSTRWSIFPNYTDWFALGMLLAVVWAWRTAGGRLTPGLEGFVRRTTPAWACGLCCYLAIVLLKGDQLLFSRSETAAQLAWRMLFQGGAAFFVVLPVALAEPGNRAVGLLSGRSITYLGTISYGLYLWHRIVQLWVGDVGEGLGARGEFVVQMALVLPITLVLAAASYHLVERPFVNLAANITRPHRLHRNDRPRLAPG